MTLSPLRPVADAGPRHHPSRVVTAECAVCDLEVEQVPGGDVLALLRAFRLHHPMTAEAPHTRLVPDGWREPWSRPGSWSN